MKLFLKKQQKAKSYHQCWLVVLQPVINGNLTNAHAVVRTSLEDRRTKRFKSGQIGPKPIMRVKYYLEVVRQNRILADFPMLGLLDATKDLVHSGKQIDQVDSYPGVHSI